MRAEQSPFLNPAWLGRLRESVNNSADATRRALQSVLRYVGEVGLFELLYVYAESGNEWPERLIEAKKFIAKLTKVSKALDNVLLELKELKDHSPLPQVRTLPSVSDPEHLVSEAQVEEYAAYLHETIKVLKRFFTAKRKPHDDEFLIVLWLTIKAESGNPHWGDIAYLLESAFYVSGFDEHFDSDKVKQRIKRFQKDYPDVFKFWATHIRKSNQLPASSPKPAAKKVSTPTKKGKPQKKKGGFEHYVLHGPARKI